MTLRSLEQLGWLPFHEIEGADGQITECKHKEHHHQHASRLAPGFDLFDLGANRTGSNPRGLCQGWTPNRALHGPPLPLHHWCVSRYLLGKVWASISNCKHHLCRSRKKSQFKKNQKHQDYWPAETTACDISEYRPGPWGTMEQSRWQWRSRCDTPLGRSQLWEEENELSLFA